MNLLDILKNNFISTMSLSQYCNQFANYAKLLWKKIIIEDEKGGLVLPIGGCISNRDKEWILYKNLKIHDVASLNFEKIPKEFSQKSLKIIDEFRKKTAFSSDEWFLYFDYVSGEIIYCFYGKPGHVEGNIDSLEFAGRHIASIHNHPINYYSPPSAGNFQILEFDFEDYEIICGEFEFWVLEAKGIFLDEMIEINDRAIEYYNFSNNILINNINDDELFYRCNALYGRLLSNFISNNYSNISLIKGEYYGE